MTDRTAVDTIKGYFYQFDYAIAELLGLSSDFDSIIVEGVEDVDLETATENTAVQCKYYAKTEYNHSVIAKPIRLMLDHYKEVTIGDKSRIYYRLYGYFNSGQEKITLPIDITFLKESFLTYTKDKIKYAHHINLNLSDQELDDFLSLLTINIVAMDYENQLKNIFNLLKKTFKCNSFEAENFYYNNALKVIKDIAVEAKVTDRRISKSDFINRINFKRILFNEWFMSFKGMEELFKELRNQYFTNLNSSSFERFFLIEIPDVNYLRSELKELIFTISKKWSKFSPREPNPFCPYLYLNNISPQELLDLKKELHLEDFLFIDGFDFEGADFNPKSISKSINSKNPIKIKIINKLENIDLSIKEITKTKEIFQFYINDPFFNVTYPHTNHVRIQFTKLNDIKKII